MSAKRSFVRLPVAVDAARLASEVEALPAGAWRRSHWRYPHGAVEQVLLRGGQLGLESDFYLEDDVADHAVLARLPYTASLIGQMGMGPAGPFGGATFAFLFRMRPGGHTDLHYDAMPVWVAHHRVHVPVTTNPGAYLIASERWLHLPLASAWTFDNQSLHGAVNGPEPRIHLIMDVAVDLPAMRDLIARGALEPGDPLPAEVRELCLRPP